MRIVNRPMLVLIAAAVAALLLDVSPSCARPGGGRGRSAPSASRSHAGPTPAVGNHGPTQAHQQHNGPAAQAAQSGSRPQMAGPNHRPQRAGNHPQQSVLQRQAAQAHWQNRGQHHQNAQARWHNYQNGPQPFTPAWYAQHPNAWHTTHPHADQWAVASAAALGSWLGWATAPQESYSSTTIIYDDSPEVDDADDYVDASPADVELPAGDWLPLGVYSIVTAPDQPSMQLVQLAVDRNGVVRGVYYDAMTNTSHSVVGSIDRDTQQVQWTLESNPNLAFQAGIDQLTQPTGVVEVTLPGGDQEWQLVRLANTPE